MGTLLMSGRERRRLEWFSRVKDGELSVSAAGELLGLSERQARRVWKRYRRWVLPGWFMACVGVVAMRRGDRCVSERWRCTSSTTVVWAWRTRRS